MRILSFRLGQLTYSTGQQSCPFNIQFPAWCPPHGTCKQGREELDIGSDHKIPLQSSSEGGGPESQADRKHVSLRLGHQKYSGAAGLGCGYLLCSRVCDPNTAEVRPQLVDFSRIGGFWNF